MVGSGAETHQREPLTLVGRDVALMLADERGRVEIMMLDDQGIAALKLAGLRELPQLEVLEDELFARTWPTKICLADTHGQKPKQSAGRMSRKKHLSYLRPDYYLPETFGPILPIRLIFSNLGAMRRGWTWRPTQRRRQPHAL